MRLPTAAVLALLLALLVAACATSIPVSPPPGASATASSTAATSSSTLPPASIPASIGSVGNAASVPPTGVAADPTLLELVPAAEAGATLTYDPETTATVAAEPSLARDVSYLAIGLARPLNGAADDPNFAIVNLVRVRNPGNLDDAWFRGWRDTYDEAACAGAGGVARHAQFDVARRVVYVGGCANGAFTYHVLVGDGAIVLSLTSVGPADLGRQIVQRLGP